MFDERMSKSRHGLNSSHTLIGEQVDAIALGKDGDDLVGAPVSDDAGWFPNSLLSSWTCSSGSTAPP